MRRFIDLHTHSTASDGSLSPAELIGLAEAKGLAAVALTDHDTTAGLAAARAAAAKCPELRFAGGIEISAQWPTGTLHIIGLGIDENSGLMEQVTAQLRLARNERNPKIIARLQGMGMDITMDDVLATASASGKEDRELIVSRVHIAETLLRKGLVRSTKDAFNKLIGQGKPAYEDKDRLSPSEAAAAIRDARGVAFLAHPIQLKYEDAEDLKRIVGKLMDEGLEGIEAYHTDHTIEQVRLYLDLAQQYGMEICGGSDFHGPAKPEASLGRVRVPLSIISESLAQRIFESS